MSGSALDGRTLHHQRRATLLGAALVAACYPIDLGQPNPALTIPVRTAWIAAALLAAWAQQPGRPRLARAGGHLAGGASGLAVVAIVALSGGTRSVFEGMLLAIPFAVLVAFPRLPTAAGLAAGIAAAGGLAVRYAEGQAPFHLAAWLVVSLVMGTLAVYGTAMARLLLREEGEAEHLAEAGRLATGVVQELSSPLAAVRTNLRALASGAIDSAEREEVLADAIAGVERITGAVAVLGRCIQPTERPRGANGATRRGGSPDPSPPGGAGGSIGAR